MIIGVLGAGQLARMLALAGYPLGHSFVFLCPDPKSCAAKLGEHICADYEDQNALLALADKVDLVTYEFENIPSATVEFLARSVPVHPSHKALIHSQDRSVEKGLFQQLQIATPKYAVVTTIDELHDAVAAVGLPAVLKTCRDGYDGKGQVVLRENSQINDAWEHVQGNPCVLESLIPFDREVSIISVRAINGDTVFYPLSENVHREGILRISKSRLNDPMQEHAEHYAGKLLNHLDYVGTLAIEFFQVDGKLVANEMAPRVHNSGHWTIEGSITSQFENHIRAITGMPLGSAGTKESSAMVNYIGTIPDPSELLKTPDVHFHDYGKEDQPGRKVGHVTFCGQSTSMAETLLKQIQSSAAQNIS